MKIVVSACLLGENCKYNGGNNYCPRVVEFTQGKKVIPVCPEMAAGFGCPRIPMEIVNGRLKNREGTDLHDAMDKAIASILAELEGEEIACAVLKSRSPTCGVRQVYDGTFSGTLVSGMGLFAQALHQKGIPVIDSEEV